MEIKILDSIKKEIIERYNIHKVVAEHSFSDAKSLRDYCQEQLIIAKEQNVPLRINNYNLLIKELNEYLYSYCFSMARIIKASKNSTEIINGLENN